MIKRISLLVAAALLVATMAMAGLAGPASATRCGGDHPGAPDCTSTGKPQTVVPSGNAPKGLNKCGPSGCHKK